MAKKKKKTRKFESETIGLPSLQIVIGDVPVPDPSRKDIPVSQNWPGKSKTVVQLIDHLAKKE